MKSGTVKTSTILISSGDDTKVFRSRKQVPPRLRRKLEETTNGANAATIIIADRKGREELMKALEGKSSRLRFRVAEPGRRSRIVKRPVLALLELGAVGLIGLLVWILFLIK